MKEIDWDSIVEQAEQEWKQNKWKEFGASGKGKYGLELVDKPLSEEGDAILDEIAIENDRVDPNSCNNFDQEEVWRATGRYLVRKKGK